MLDVSHIPGLNTTTQTFYAQGATAWQTWAKPRGAKFIQLFCLGSGGGGGNGASNAGSRQGGGGGGAGAITRAIIPTFLLPDTLFIQVAVGGAALSNASATATTGNAGGHSYISCAPTSSAQSVIIASSVSNALGGNPVAGNQAAGGGAFAATNGAFSALTIFSATSGPNGNAVQAAGLPGLGQTALASSLVTGGASGGSCTVGVGYSGGNIAPAVVILTSAVSGSVGANVAGNAPEANSGYTIMNPFCSTGGGGGAGNGAGIGGFGGDGGLGSGGGGGGGGQTNATRRSGKGGDGLIIITTIF
jgi:hypothetical protein